MESNADKGMDTGYNLGTVFNSHINWAMETFPKQTSIGAITHLMREAIEVVIDIKSGASKESKTEEYADCFGCLLSSMSMEGITLDELLDAFQRKLEKNKLCTWDDNGDGSYSHVKVPPFKSGGVEFKTGPEYAEHICNPYSIQKRFYDMVLGVPKEEPKFTIDRKGRVNTFKPNVEPLMVDSFICTKPHCNCLDIAEHRAGGGVKNYPCLGNKATQTDELKKAINSIKTRFNHDSEL